MGSFGYGFGVSRRTNLTAALMDTATSVTRDGVTFTFSEERPVGQYANGDWWVRGPVTITSISPDSTTISGTYASGTAYSNRKVNGAMLNPGNRIFAVDGQPSNNGASSPQGWDGLPPEGGDWGAATQTQEYFDATNVDPANTGSSLTVVEGTVVKAISKGASGVSVLPTITDLVPLTVVRFIPPADAIRPGYSRSDTSWRIRASQFDLSVFKSLTPPAGAPTFEQALATVDRLKEVATTLSPNSRNMQPLNHGPAYGRDIGYELNQAYLALHFNTLSDEQKRTLLTHLAVVADDLVARAEEGGIVPAAGGGNGWKKPQIAIVAAALGVNAPASMLEYLDKDQQNVWHVDLQVGRVSANDVITPRDVSDGRPRDPYTFQMVGSAEWMEQGADNPARGDSGWANGNTYRDIVYGQLLGGVLAVQLTDGAEALWNHPEFFTYMDTAYLRRSEATTGNDVQPFVEDMLVAHRPGNPAAPAIIEAQMRDSDLWITFDQGLDELDAPPAPGDFLVNVNGSSVSVTSVSLFRQNVGLTLASAVSEGDTVDVSYTPGASPLVSVDQVPVAAFSGQAVSWFVFVGNLGPSLFTTDDMVRNGHLPNIEFLSQTSLRGIVNGNGLGRATIPAATISPGNYRVRGVISAYDGTAGSPTGVRLRILNGFSQVHSQLGVGVLDEVIAVTSYLEIDAGSSGRGFRLDDFHIEAVPS